MLQITCPYEIFRPLPRRFTIPDIHNQQLTSHMWSQCTTLTHKHTCIHTLSLNHTHPHCKRTRIYTLSLCGILGKRVSVSSSSCHVACSQWIMTSIDTLKPTLTGKCGRGHMPIYTCPDLHPVCMGGWV